GQDEHASDDLVDLLQSELEPGDDTEVAAAAADRPEQVGVRLVVDPQHLTASGDDVGRHHVVDGEAVLAGQVADAAAQREAADPYRTGVAEAHRETVLSGRSGELGGGEAGLGPGRAASDVDVDRRHVAQVDDQPVVGGAVAGPAVPAAADCERQAGLARESDR